MRFQIFSLISSIALVTSITKAQDSPSLASVKISTVKPDLIIPEISVGAPAPGLRTKQVLPGFEKSQVYHIIYLPSDWSPEREWPVIIELPGNGNYRNQHGDTSSGLPEQCQIGYGLSRGKGCIWVSTPFLSGKGQNIAISWWGDAPKYNPTPTIDYLKQTVNWICKTYQGDPERVILAGFSRGAIACNYIGLHDDEIAKLWSGMFVYSHYDGIRKWPFPNSDSESARMRLNRLKEIPQFICHENNGVSETRSYLKKTGVKGNFTFTATGFVNHNGAWLLRPSPARAEARNWFEKLTKPSR